MTIPLPRRGARVLGARQLSATGFELRLARGDVSFRAGQEIMIHGPAPEFDRTYSIASGEKEDHLCILYRLIPEGRLTPRLVALQPGDTIEFTGPFGSFVLRDAGRPLVFIATGTGIAPCAGFLNTHPLLEATVLHGVRTAEDLFYRELFARCDYRPCVSREESPWFRGRVTELLPSLALPPEADYYLCGFNEMIADARAYLRKSGIHDDRIISEAYYFW